MAQVLTALGIIGKPYAFIGEPALHQNIGDGSVMVEQLKYLLEMAQRPNITIRLIPHDHLWHRFT